MRTVRRTFGAKAASRHLTWFALAVMTMISQPEICAALVVEELEARRTDKFWVAA